MGARKNPVERRMDRIHDAWVEFAEDPAARLLCLLVAPDEHGMLNAFFGAESDELGELPDLFVELEAGFETNGRYGFELREEFLEQAHLLYLGLEQPDAPEWVPPPLRAQQTDLAAWVGSLKAFAEHHQLPGCLAILLRPDSVSDTAAFQLWLQQLVQLLPAKLRVIVVDEARAPHVQPLLQADPLRIRSHALDLDMARARLEVSQQAGGLDTPGGRFRHLFVQFTNLLGAGKLAEASDVGAQALAISAAQRWFALAVPVHFALAAALAGAQRPEEALHEFALAEGNAAQGEQAGQAVCQKLRAQARLARGGLLITTAQYEPAAELFSATLPLALALGDGRMVLDCHRLASFCHEQAGQTERAWQAGLEGLQFARSLDAETRATSTLAYLGEGMLRTSEHETYRDQRSRIERDMEELVGRKEWRPAGAPPSPAPPPAPGPSS